MSGNDISFYGYNDGKAITIHNSISLFWPTIISFLIASIMTVFSIAFSNYFLLVIWGLPLLFVIIFLINIAFTKYNNNVFLDGKRKKHTFRLKDGILFKDGKEIKSVNKIRLYKFKKFIFLELKNSYYRISNEDFIAVSRNDFLTKIKYNKLTHRIFIDK